MFSRMPSENDVCPTVLLSDRVATEDAFGHEKIAHAIAEMMLKHHEAGCAVALIGPWGSGKSTVVDFLSTDLETADKEFGTFVFDAWAHQGDPLRRTFLEKLIGWFQEKPGWTIDGSDWNGALGELSRRKEKTTTENRPHLTPSATVGALSLLIVPIAIQAFQKFDFRTNRTASLISAIFALLPLLIGTIILRNWWVGEADKPEDQRKPIPSLVFSSLETTVVSETSKDGEPTSVEFEKWYRKVVGEGLEENNRRLLIVLDNLDRIPPEEALSIWSTLRIFFDRTHHESHKWQNRVWVLIPLDQEAIVGLWETSSIEGAQGGESNFEMVASRSYPISQHFLEKTFQVTFRVPPVVLLGWEEYLLRQLRTAFPDPRHDDEEFQLIFRLYDRLSPRETVTPTPRNLKIFVNDLGAIHRQWQDEIPLPQQAAFALVSKHRSTKEVMAVLRSGSTVGPPSPGSVITSLLGAVWERNFAAMLFNVAVEEAFQALLSDPISQALARGNGLALAALEDNPGFAESLEAELETRFVQPTPDSTSLTRAISAFSQLKGGWNRYEKCSSLLLRDLKTVQSWDPFDETVAQAIKSLCQSASRVGDIAPILNGIQNSLRSRGQEPQVAKWLSVLAGLLPNLIAIDERAIREHFSVTGDTDQYLKVIAAVPEANFPRQFLKYLRPSFRVEDLGPFVVQKISEFELSPMIATALPFLAEILPTWDWNAITSALVARLRDSPQPPKDLQVFLKLIYELLPSRADLRESLAQAARADTLFQLVQLAAQTRDTASIARCALPLIGGPAAIPRQTLVGQGNTPQWRAAIGKNLLGNLIYSNGNQREVLEALAADCLKWCSLEEWRGIAQQYPPKGQLINRMLGLLERTN